MQLNLFSPRPRPFHVLLGTARPGRIAITQVAVTKIGKASTQQATSRILLETAYGVFAEAVGRCRITVAVCEVMTVVLKKRFYDGNEEVGLDSDRPSKAAAGQRRTRTMRQGDSMIIGCRLKTGGLGQVIGVHLVER